MTKPHSRATRLAATFLARQSSPEAAATALGIDPRTVRSWLETVEIPDDEWTAIRDVLLARGGEMAALGKTNGLPAILTGAGIADRNVRYGQLIARREARRSDETCDCVLPPGWVPGLHPKPGTPEHARAVWDIAAAKMSPSRRNFFHTLTPLIAYFIDHKNGDAELDIPEAREATNAAMAGVPNDTDDALGALRQWIEGLDDETLAARQALVDAAWAAYREALFVELERRAYDEVPTIAADALDPESKRQLRDWALDKLDELGPEEPRGSSSNDDEPEPDVSEPAPTPIRRASRAPEPVPMVLDVGDPDHDRGWTPLERIDY